ncbi:MAG TPA: choice-of-anchor P family protein [Acidimicrobiia bacterium]|nr:choice-of-anchor P family protein [Acidimicrobiia bacterium]
MGALSSLIAVTAVAAPVAAAAKPVRMGHNANAFGTSAKVSSVFTSSPSGLAALGCTNTSGLQNSNTVVGGGFLTAGFVGAVNDTVSTKGSSTSAESQIATVSLFSDELHSDTVTVTASVSHDDSGFTFTGDTQAENLVINGSPMTVPAPNTVIPIPGLGNLTVNEQITSHTKTTATIIENAFHLEVLATNAFNFPVGANIVVGHAQASLTTVPSRYVDGQAYGSQVQGTGINAGRSALVFLPCDGTNGRTKTHSLQTTTVPNVISIGTQKSTVTGVGSKGFATSTSTESVQNITLINLISIDSVKAVASAQSIGKTRTFNDTGSSSAGISVLGIPTIPDNVKPNTTYPIQGVGTLYLHRIIQTDHKIEVRMVELVVTVDTGTLPVGTDIRIGVAEASIHST